MDMWVDSSIKQQKHQNPQFKQSVTNSLRVVTGSAEKCICIVEFVADLPTQTQEIETTPQAQTPQQNPQPGSADLPENAAASSSYYHFDSEGNKFKNKWRDFDVESELAKVDFDDTSSGLSGLKALKPKQAAKSESVNSSNGLPSSFPFTAEVTKCKLKSKGVSDIQLRQDGLAFAVAGWDHKIRVFDWENKRSVVTLRHHKAGVQALAFSPSAVDLAAGSADARVSLWNLS